ncbi:MAG: S1 RNA-binding domain-containing protein, partial [Aquificae bacterium]|nr:S1 RNA-binding domain-containing protein [Aquificota bacterium]
ESLTLPEEFRKGQVVKGKVIKVSGDTVFVDIGYKTEAVISKEEIPDVKEGDEIEAVIIRFSPRIPNPVLSRRPLEEQKELQNLHKAYLEKRDVVGKVEKKTRGGFIVDFEGIKAFMPASETGKRIKEGQVLNFKILDIKLDGKRPKIIVSHKAYLEEQREKKKEELLNSLKPGDVVEGKVVKVDTNKGVTLIVDGVLRAFLPKEELSWGRDRNPYNYTDVGEKLKVKVKRVDRAKGFIIVSLRELKGNPWEKFVKEFKEGDVVQGKVVAVTPRGLIVELVEGVEGLVPEEEIAWEGKPEYKKGDTVKVKILRIEPKRRRVILSIKRALPRPWEEYLQKHPAGSKVRGKVLKIEGSRAIVELEDNVKGIIHRSDLSWTRPKRMEEVLKEGEEREFAVLGLEGKFVKLGIKQLTENPWEKVAQKYKVGDVVKLPVKELAPFGAFLELPEGVEGLLPFSEVPRHVRVKQGEEYEVKIIDINPKEGKVTFSLKALMEELPEEEEVKEEVLVTSGSSAGGFKLGEILKKKWKMK